MRRGWTLFEVLVSVAVLGCLLVVISEALGTTQRSLSSTTATAHLASTRTEAVSALTSVLDRLALNTRPQFIEGTAQITHTSDLHFVCGPVSELLPGMDDVVGDALFYQCLNRDGLVECGGFFTQFNDDSDTRPAFLSHQTPTQRHFRLMQWRQPPAQSTLFVNATATTRDAVYRWFRDGVRQKDQLHVVADHVMAMWVRTEPVQRCYDTRRLQWEGATADALASASHLPAAITVRLLVTSGRSWDHAFATGAGRLAQSWIQFVPTLPADAAQSTASADNWLQARGLECRALEIAR